MVILEFLQIIFAGILAGFLGAITGLGGGTVLVPVLTLFFGVPIIFAVGASLISTIATSAGSASAYTKEKIANIKIGVGLEVATTTGAILGTLALVYVETHDLEWLIYVLFGSVLLFSLLPTIKRTFSELPPDIPADWTTRVFQLRGSYYDARLKTKVEYKGVRWWAGEMVMFMAGFISGLLGIGSGALKVMGMDWAMNLPMKVTTTTSNFMIGITAATGSSIYWSLGYVQPFLAAGTAIGVVLGSYVGAKMLVRISNGDIRWIFFAVLSFLGIEMIFRGLYLDGLSTITPFWQVSISLIVSVALMLSAFSIIRVKRRMMHIVSR
ncbi:MAG: sulfite exporter TauE/SafE family protein [Candidatus Thermoplasmatota archaeon]|jgi:uncharacterized membrane protein YfcA|nr:sulfite exporter TauE/SafE family protein [Candidatus Thermoplasmatota archaeon]MCL5786419.1 sulfite exporter TauE/SafE family protein [Candidatus Thermoplasmatota archaeon]